MKNLQSRITWLFLVLMIGMLTASLSFAESSQLTKPKANGLIGEQANGYIGLVVNDVPPEIRKLVSEVNAKRKAGYQKIAEKQGISLSEVEKVGGKTAYEKTLKGNYFRDTNGTWRKK